MILSDRRYPFGSRVTRIKTRSFSVMVSTAKEGISEPQSLMIFELTGDAETAPRGPVIAKMVYTKSLSPADRLHCHETVAASLDRQGENGTKIGEAIDQVIGELQNLGVLHSATNAASASNPFTDVTEHSDLPELSSESLEPAPRFCSECGGHLVVAAKFCPNCGIAIVAPPPLPPRPPEPSSPPVVIDSGPTQDVAPSATISQPIQTQNQVLGTRWLTWEVYFALPVSALMLLGTAGNYAQAGNGFIEACSFIGCLAQLATWIGLIRRTLWGWQLRLRLTFFAPFLTGAIYIAAPTEKQSAAGLQLVAACIVSALLYIYWSKRKYLYDAERSLSVKHWIAAPIIGWCVIGIAIIAAIALPAYQDNVKRSHAQTTNIYDQFDRGTPSDKPTADFDWASAKLIPPSDSKNILPSKNINSDRQSSLPSEQDLQRRLAALAAVWCKVYPFLDSTSPGANPQAIDAVLARRDQLISQGMPVLDALDAAVRGIAPKYLPTNYIDQSSAIHALRQAEAVSQTVANRSGGENISLNFVDTSIRAIIQIIADVSDTTLILDPAINYNISVKQRNRPWQEVLNTLLDNNDLQLDVRDGTGFISRAKPVRN